MSFLAAGFKLLKLPSSKDNLFNGIYCSSTLSLPSKTILENNEIKGVLLTSCVSSISSLSEAEWWSAFLKYCTNQDN